jgi:hypothetical protein
MGTREHHAREHKRLCLARRVLMSLVDGALITLLLAVVRAARIAPSQADILLRPGQYLLRVMPGKGIPNILVETSGDVVFYASLVFVLRRLKSKYRPSVIDVSARTDRRRRHRVLRSTPVSVYGWSADEPFSENTETLNICSTGGLIRLSAKVTPSQELILTNLETDQDLRCRVARSVATDDGKTLAGLDFLQDSPGFWQIHPVPDSRPTARVASLVLR